MRGAIIRTRRSCGEPDEALPGSRLISKDFMTNFSDFALGATFQNTLKSEGYEEPTPIQQQAIPLALEGRDILGIAQTGTGKTAAFSLPSLHRLNEKKLGTGRNQCRMLVLAPTRELAKQIADSMVTYGRGTGLYVTTAFGGVPINRQKRALAKGVDVLVATPGRLLDLYDQNSLDLSMVEILVLDEADQMLDLGFMQPLKRIVKLLPYKRQSLFFSATMPKTIAELSQQFLRDPAKVSVAPQSTTAEKVDQYGLFVRSEDKPQILASLLRSEDPDRVLVFTRTKHGADRLVKHLERVGIDAVAIHGNKSQPQREKALNAFRRGGVSVLVATDIAARGIDVSGVSHVFNYELPNVPEQYVHRIGRTARADASGTAIALVGPEERQWLRDIERTIKMKLEIAPLPKGFDKPEIEELPPPQMGGQRQQRFKPRPAGAKGKPAGRDGARKPSGDRRGGEGKGGQRAGGQNRGPSAGKPGGGNRRRRTNRGGGGGGRPQG